MSLLKEVIRDLRKPIAEGKGIKAFRLPVNEGWGWEDVWSDMIDDHGVQGMVQDVKREWKTAQDMGIDAKTFIDYVSTRIDRFQDEAQVELTDEEETVFLKAVENVVLKGAAFMQPWKV